MDEILAEILGVDSSRAFDFFLSGLREVTGREPNDEMFYVATVLAHYAETSRYDAVFMPVLANLSEVFDNFVFAQADEPEILEIGGSQVLLFAGFFRDQMKRRHNVRWFDKIGQSLYFRAGQTTKDMKRGRFLSKLAETLPQWTRRCRDLSRMYRDDRYLLRID